MRNHREYSRSQRMASLIQKDLSAIIYKSLNDQRLTSVTISEVNMSSDLGHANIYVSFLGISCPNSIEEHMIALKNSSALLRKSLAGSLKCRKIPQLHFYYDNSFNQGEYMDQLINRALNHNSSPS